MQRVQLGAIIIYIKDISRYKKSCNLHYLFNEYSRWSCPHKNFNIVLQCFSSVASFLVCYRYTIKQTKDSNFNYVVHNDNGSKGVKSEFFRNQYLPYWERQEIQILSLSKRVSYHIYKHAVVLSWRASSYYVRTQDCACPYQIHFWGISSTCRNI